MKQYRGRETGQMPVSCIRVKLLTSRVIVEVDCLDSPLRLRNQTASKKQENDGQERESARVGHRAVSVSILRSRVQEISY